MSTIVISEIGENHLGKMELAKKMIRLSKDSGADYAKFQLYDSARTSADDPEREWFSKVALSRRQMSELTGECRRTDIRPLFTSWDTERARWCLEEGMKEIKVASFHIADIVTLEFIAGRFETVFLSTGMCSEEEVERAVKILTGVKHLYLLHCVSDYPARHEDINLRYMDTLRKFGRPVGYSDHTLGTATVLAAVARGAEVIEKHFTLSRDLPGTDHIFSADPGELKHMVEEIRKIEKVLGTGEKRMTAQEARNQQFLRKRFSY